ncbi:MAG: class I SAM-dependent methyltransferase [Candidatus Lokiarchaeota archaeon]
MKNIVPFEKFPDKYENWFKENKYAYKSELLAIKKVLPKDKESIEIGVGSARFASPLGIRIGIDPSVKMLKIAQKRDILVINAVAEKLPFRSHSFNISLMITTICFLENIKSALIEIFRILKPGSSIIIGFIDKESIMGKLYQERKNKSVFYKIAKFYSVKEILSHLKKSGFSFFECFQTIFSQLGKIRNFEPSKSGYGKGSFVVIKAIK